MNDPIAFFLQTLRQYDIQSVSDESGVHFTTLYTWLRGQHLPSLASIDRVAPTIGLELSFQNARPTLRVVA